MKLDFNKTPSDLLKKARDDRHKMQDEHFAKLLPRFGEETVRELKNFYSLYDEKLYVWFAGLWRSDGGGFYYSNSARDNDGFLPDLESTAQALSFAQRSGLLSAYGDDIAKALPGECNQALVGFVKDLQDPDDGYFYHPQWGKDITITRRGRDLGWGIRILDLLGVRPNYPTALERIKQKDLIDIKEGNTVPEHLRSVEAFKKYLNEMDLEKRSYAFGNIVASQHSQIKSAGEEYMDAAIEFFNKSQRSDNGLWQEKVNYDSVNGLFKISALYTRFEKPIPNAEIAFESALYAAMSDEPVTFVCEFYNPWCVMNDVLSNICKFGKKETAFAMRKRLCKMAPELLRVTMRKVGAHKKADGSFSYAPHRSASKSQGAPVALPDSNEGDVNASCISSTGLLCNGVCTALGVDLIPLFGEEDSRVFIKLLES